MKQLEPALLSTAKPPALEIKASHEGVPYAVRADEAGTAYVLAANPDAAREATLQVRGPGGSQGQHLRRSTCRPLEPDAGVFSIHLAPMDAGTLIVRQRK